MASDPVGLDLDHRWSPDGQFLAYSLNEDNSFSSIFVWSAADGSSHRVTPQLFSAQSPAWAPDGELLYFLSQREYQPIVSTIEFNFATDRQTGIFAVTLRKDVKNPFGIRDNEPGDAKDDDADKEKDQQKGKNGKDKPSPGKNRIRRNRAAHDPRTNRADDISNLQVGDETLLYLRSGPFYYGRDSSVKPTVMAYSIKEREAKPVAEDVIDWSATANGKHVLAQMASKELKYFEVGQER